MKKLSLCILFTLSVILMSGCRPPAPTSAIQFKIYTQSGKPQNLRILEIIKHQIESADPRLSVTIETREKAAFFQAVTDGEADAFFLDWYADYPDAENFLHPLFSSANRGSAGNRAQFSDEAVDRTIRMAIEEADAARREELYRRAEELVAEKAPWIFLWHPQNFRIRSNNVTGGFIPLTPNHDRGAAYKPNPKAGFDERLDMRLSADPQSLDPAMVRDVPSSDVAAKLHAGLVCFSDDLQKIEPDLADCTISDDGLTYTFTLNEKAKFSNFRPVLASDVEFSFRRVLSPTCPRNWVLAELSGAQDLIDGKTDELPGIEIIDERTIKLKLDKPFGPFLSKLTMPAAYIAPKSSVENLRDNFSKRPIGAGPYMLAEWERGQYLLLKRNPVYHRLPRAQFKELRYAIHSDDDTAWNEYLLGNIDVLNLPSNKLEKVLEDNELRSRFIHGPSLATVYIGLNCSREPFNDERLRRALNYAVDSREILSELMQGRGRIATGPIPPSLPGKNTELKGYERDPGKVSELLDDILGTTEP